MKGFIRSSVINDMRKRDEPNWKKRVINSKWNPLSQIISCFGHFIHLRNKINFVWEIKIMSSFTKLSLINYMWKIN